MSSETTRNATSLPESEAGRTHCNSPASQMMFDFGRDHVHANRFRAPESMRASKTNGKVARIRERDRPASRGRVHSGIHGGGCRR